MCLFTDVVDEVSDTNIFARVIGGRQLLAYEMSYAARSELAMVLPIPVAAGTGEDGVRFIDLGDCPRFFEELRDGFPAPRSAMLGSIEGMTLGDTDLETRILEVHDVGAYEASFVPTPADFGRLDERFRLPVDLWLELDAYRDYGFAVFKLRPAGLHREHPMGFEFPTRHPDRIFFPTMHLHDRRLAKTARFDHSLYCQSSHAMQFHMRGWEDSPEPAGAFIRCPDARPLFDLALSCWKLEMKGEFPNADTWIGAGSRVPKGGLEIVG